MIGRGATRALKAHMTMIQTSVGLPNSCSVCGKPVTAQMWWAECDDFARAGSGFCDACRAPTPQPKQIADAPCIDNALSKQTDADLNLRAWVDLPSEPIRPESRKPKGKAK